MYGLESGKKQLFQFDLEVDIKKNPKKAKELLEKTNSRCQEMKKLMKAGGSKKELENWGTLLHGYTSLSKVLSKIAKQ